MNSEEKDVCTKGKSCGAACIKTNLVCQNSFTANVQDALTKFASIIARPLQGLQPKPVPPPLPKDPALRTIEKGKQFLGEYSKKLDALGASMAKMREENEALRQKMGGRVPSKDQKAAEVKLAKNLASLKEMDGRMLALMGEIRGKMLQSKLSQSQINKMVGNVDIIKGSKNEAELRKQLVEFAKMFGGKGFSNTKDTPKDVNPLTTIFYGKNERGWADWEMGHMRLDGRSETTFHEMGHYVEAQRPWLEKYLTDWRNKKAWDSATVDKMYGAEDLPPEVVGTIRQGKRDLPIIPLSYLTGSRSYGPDEAGLADEYLSPYMGKVYEERGTEVMSMSIQHFSSPAGMVTLRKAYPEIFNLIVGLSAEK